MPCVDFLHRDLRRETDLYLLQGVFRFAGKQEKGCHVTKDSMQCRAIWRVEACRLKLLLQKTSEFLPRVSIGLPCSCSFYTSNGDLRFQTEKF